MDADSRLSKYSDFTDLQFPLSEEISGACVKHLEAQRTSSALKVKVSLRTIQHFIEAFEYNFYGRELVELIISRSP